MHFRNISLTVLVVVILEFFCLSPSQGASVKLKEQYRPVYVPYIFQLLGDKGWESRTKSFTGKETTSKADSNKIPYNTQTSRQKNNYSEINLKGTGKFTVEILYRL